MGGDGGGLSFLSLITMKVLNPQNVQYLVIHCTATNPRQRLTPQMLELMHKAQGWETAGYHYYITTSGKCWQFRNTDQQGAHVLGYNDKSIGIAYEGGCDGLLAPKDTLNADQEAALVALILQLREQFPQARIVGHNELNPKKACPSFKVRERLPQLFE